MVEKLNDAVEPSTYVGIPFSLGKSRYPRENYENRFNKLINDKEDNKNDQI